MLHRILANNTTKNVAHHILQQHGPQYGCCGSFEMRRFISSGELSSLLRPFYFAVHPDLFGQYPEQRVTNEESLKHLSAYLESVQNQQWPSTLPKFISFYVREKEVKDSFRVIRVALKRQSDLKQFLKQVLESCNLSTEKIDKIKTTSKRYVKHTQDYNVYSQADGTINEEYEMYMDNLNRARMAKTLKRWLDNNIKTANERTDSLETIRADVKKLENKLTTNLILSGIGYDCAWNVEHIRGCLKSLDHLSRMHEDDLKGLNGRTIVFARASGVSLEGHVMLSTEDVQHNWLDFIKNISKKDEYLKHIPAYEKALSQVLRGIKVSRRKFMPKAQVDHYAAHLRKVTTTLLDYLTKHSSYPDTWPTDLSKFEIVIESEAGPLCVSPTGQFIAPSTCPGSILVDFLSTHMNEAREKSIEYNKNKHIEKELHRKCVRQLDLKVLSKDDSIDPKRMIGCLERLLELNIQIANGVLHITHYYSVLSDGTICIPWDWVLE